MAQASQNAGQWQQLREILPKVEKLEILSPEKILHLSNHSISQQLEFAETETELQATWDSLNKDQKLNNGYIHAYAQTGLKLGMNEQVAQLTEKTINKMFSDVLLNIWSQLNIDNNDRIKIAEKWLKKNPENPLLLKTLGSFCLQNKLWGKALDYLQKSTEILPQPDTYKLMAQYFDAVGEPDNALQAYQQAEMYRSQLVLVDDSGSDKT